jgi:hypothetical protein
VISEILKPTNYKVQEKSHMEKFVGATNFAILLHIVEGIGDGIHKVNTLGQIEASKRDMPILRHVHVPLSSIMLSLYSNPSKT